MWIVATACGLVLLFSYRTSTIGARSTNTVANAPAANGLAPGIVSGGGGDGGGPDTTGTPAAPPVPSPSTSPSAPAPASPTAGNGTRAGQDLVVNGTVAQTRWGPVQVQVRISAGKIKEVTVLQQPNGNRRDQEINAYAVPILRGEVLNAQSAQIDTVSGATVTSNGYVESLQAALDTAHFKA